jgi:AcrR family transcriptional regulator
MRELAKACNLSQAGLLHYFSSKEDLLLSILQWRENQQLDPASDLSAARFIDRVISNEREKPLTRLWANLVGEATNPEHPAHDYFKNRFSRSRREFEKLLAERAGRQKPNRDDKLKAQILIAMWDGLQNQWLIDEAFDMKPAFKYALKMLDAYQEKI